ncbi:MAG: protein of unknown function [Nitrospira sp.]
MTHSSVPLQRTFLARTNNTWLSSLALVFMTLPLHGCGMFDQFWDKEIRQVYSPKTSRDKQRDFFIQSLNYHLGKSKADRIRVFGPPDKCTTQSSAKEICEWKQLSDSQEHVVTYTYGNGDLATSWSYRGYFGEFTDTNYAVVGSVSSVKPQREPAPPQEERWIHPAKNDRQFEQDDVQCKTEAQMYPKAVWETETEKCLKRHGWTQGQK